MNNFEQTVKEYEECLQSCVDALGAEGLEKLVSDLCFTIAGLGRGVRGNAKFWQSKMEKYLRYAREVSNLLRFVYRAEEGFIPKSFAEITMELAYLHLYVLNSYSDVDSDDELNDEIAELLMELRSNEIVLQEREDWITLEMVDKTLAKELLEDEWKEKSEMQERIDEWYENNINPSPNYEALQESDYTMLLIALESDKKVSISGIQRKMCVGYRKAGEMLERMELAGVVSTFDEGQQCGYGRIVRVRIEDVQARIKNK